MRPGTDQSPPRQLLTVHEASDFLGLTVEAVRSRIKRGTLSKEKAPDGTVYVVVEDGAGDQARPGTAQASDQADAQALMVGRLENEVEWLRREVERKDTIIMSLSQSIAALEPPQGASSEASQSPSKATEGEKRAEGPEEHEPQRRSWWRQFFGLE